MRKSVNITNLLFPVWFLINAAFIVYVMSKGLKVDGAQKMKLYEILAPVFAEALRVFLKRAIDKYMTANPDNKGSTDAKTPDSSGGNSQPSDGVQNPVQKQKADTKP